MTAESIAEQSDAREEQFRARQRSRWAAVAPAWEKNAGYADSHGAAMTSRMLELVALRSGERVLELACGPGSVGLAAAQLVGPDGEVVMSDLVPEMTEIAQARSRAFPNVSTRVLDMHAIAEPGEAYDVVLCRDGLMLASDPALAAGEIRRVLRPAGRTAVAVWGPRARNPWLGIVFDVVSDQRGSQMPPPGVPYAFSLDNPDRLVDALACGGLADMSVEEIEVPYLAASVDEWWDRSLSLTGALAETLASLPEPALQALRARAREAVAEYRTPTGLELPGVALVAFARRRPE